MSADTSDGPKGFGSGARVAVAAKGDGGSCALHVSSSVAKLVECMVVRVGTVVRAWHRRESKHPPQQVSSHGESH